ncbi:MAG: hypothetical protein NZ805_10695 [Armatimonadetes bacterium]|nr:hypothetical protein [Armatimonadota bacterium]MDW8027165.1 hypothetical protein [Armatimonadota bacterium]
MRILRLMLPAIFLVTTFAFAQSDRSRLIIVVPPLTFGSPSTGSIVVVPSSSGIVFPGSIITSRPVITYSPTIVVPEGYFFVQLRGGNWTLVWCEPLRTNVVIIGRPYIRPVIRPAPFFFTPYFFDPSVTFGVPQVWQSPILQPGVLMFRLKNRSAEEVAKLLNEARVVPDGQFSGVGNTLIVSAPSLATSGVQQSRIRDLIAELDKPFGSSSFLQSSRKQAYWQVEVYRAHSSTCASQENLQKERAELLKLSGYPCAHKIGETLWNPATQDVSVKSNEIELQLKATRQTNRWLLSLKGKIKGQNVEIEGEAPDTSQPILIVAPIDDSKEGLVVTILPSR